MSIGWSRRFRALLLWAIVLPVGAAELPLAGTYWRLIELNGEPIVMDPASQPHIALHAAEQRVAGFSGCNRFFARYQTVDQQLTFQVMGGGRAYCEETAELERDFLKMLQRTETFTLGQERLSLNAAGARLAVFQGIKHQ